jgi:hypothetical protein
MNPENLTIGAISIFAIIITIFVTVVYKGIVDISIFISLLIYCLILIGTMRLLQHRIMDKSKKIVYYDIVLEVIKEVLEEKSHNIQSSESL